MARSHIKLWLGHLVISNRTSRHREEQYGDIPAFIIGDRCFAWWSNEQLRRLTERRQHERDFAWWYNEQLRRLGERRQQKRELLHASHNLGDFAENDTKDENSWWNRIKTPYTALIFLVALTLAGFCVWSISVMQARLLIVRSYQLGQELLLLDRFINENEKDEEELKAMYAPAYVLLHQLDVSLDPHTQPLGQPGLISPIPFGSRKFLAMLEQQHGHEAGVAFRIGYGTQEILEILTALAESENQEKGSEELKQDMMASANDKIRWHMEYFWADAETVGFPTFSVPQPTENVADDRRRLAQGYSEYVSRLTRLLYPHGSGCAVKTTLSCPK